MRERQSPGIPRPGRGQVKKQRSQVKSCAGPAQAVAVLTGVAIPSRGNVSGMGQGPDPPPENRILRYLAILSAARDFGLSWPEQAHVARAFDPLTTEPDELAGALADQVPQRCGTA